MAHSKNFEKVKKYYKMGMWSEKQVHDAVPKLITAEEFEEIVGKPY